MNTKEYLQFLQSVCPQKCIDIAEKPAVTRQEHCLHCGRCEKICPVHAVQRIGG